MMFVYELSPIDDWHGMVTLGQYFACRCRIQEREGYPGPDAGNEFDGVLRFLFEAMDHARTHGHWEGDVRRLYVSSVPTDDHECDLILGWKQSNNGTTYIASRRELPWLSERQLVVPKRKLGIA
jgi:hypothetical protein